MGRPGSEDMILSGSAIGHFVSSVGGIGGMIKLDMSSLISNISLLAAWKNGKGLGIIHHMNDVEWV